MLFRVKTEDNLETEERLVYRVDVDKYLVVGNRQELKGRISEALNDGYLEFVLDLSNTVYIDSSGLGILVYIDREINAKGGVLRIENVASEDLQTLFRLTQLCTLLPLYTPSGEHISST